VIAAIMGVETRYGRITGKIRVLDSLATQGFDHPTRSRFFMSELVQFFVYCRDGGIDPKTPQGSYAGAMGAAQFMPSNYRRLALDYDSNGSKDLWTIPDAIGSIANYFVNFRPTQSWNRGEPIAVPAHVVFPLPANVERNGKATAYTVAELTKLGIVPETKLPPDTRVGLIELPLDQGVEYWIAFHNFYTVMTYNPRTFYAMAVTQLSLQIQQQLDAQAP
jgi:membrane-bound lytic murein transglycosylase B